MRYWFVVLLAIPLIGGVLVQSANSPTSAAELWGPDLCNRSLEDMLKDIDDDESKIAQLRMVMAAAQRRGYKAEAELHKRNIESRRTDGIAGALKYIDKDLLPNCDRSQLRPDLLARIDPARALLSETELTVAVEGMPDLRITGVTSTFIPFETDDKGACSGPFIDLTFNVVNSGGDYPRPVDLQSNRERMTDAPETMLFFTIYANLDFGAGPGTGGQHVIPIDRSKFLGGIFKSGAAIKVPYHLRVGDNQLGVGISTWVQGGLFLKVANDKYDSERYETKLDIPIWDIYTQSNAALAGTTEKGAITVDTKTTITNLGKSETPGPVAGDFVIRYVDKAPPVLWNGKTGTPVSAGTSADILVRTPVDKPFHQGFIVESAILLLCPDGSYGSLSDGNQENNVRTLKEQ